jgi:hypothetical protein
MWCPQGMHTSFIVQILGKFLSHTSLCFPTFYPSSDGGGFITIKLKKAHFVQTIHSSWLSFVAVWVNFYGSISRDHIISSIRFDFVGFLFSRWLCDPISTLWFRTRSVTNAQSGGNTFAIEDQNVSKSDRRLCPSPNSLDSA